MKKIFKKQSLRVLMVMVLTIALILALAGCTMPAVTNPDGTDTVAGVAIMTGLKILEAAVVMLIGLAGASWAKKNGENTDLQNINIAVNHVIQMAQQTAGELNQTTVEHMKAETEDGKLTPFNVKELNRMLLELTLAKMAEPTKKLLTAAGVDICKLIMGAGECWIGESKVVSGIQLDQLLEVPGVVEGTVVDLNKKNDTVNSEAEPVVLVHPTEEAAKDASERRVAPLRGEPDTGGELAMAIRETAPDDSSAETEDPVK